MPRPAGEHRGAASVPATRPDRPIDVAVVLLDGGYASTAIGPIEVFHSAGLLWNWLQGEPQQPRFRVRTASVDGRPVRSVCAVTLAPQGSIDEVGEPDLILLAAPAPAERLEVPPQPRLVQWLRHSNARGAQIGAVCSGVAYLAETGLLDGRRATSHWALAPLLSDRYPRVRWQLDHFVTEDGGLFCSGGLYASIDLSLYLVDKFCGRQVALQCARSLLVSMPRSRQSGYAVVPLARPHGDEAIRRAEDYLQQHLDQPVTADELAGRLAMSPRTLARRFKAATGRMPGAYLQALRIAAARELLESCRLPVQRVGERIGYGDTAFFRSVFKRHTGMTPAEYRSRFAGLNRPAGEIAGGAA
jgi:transcriptional regulator GlxA family with amidase domain